MWIGQFVWEKTDLTTGLKHLVAMPIYAHPVVKLGNLVVLKTTFFAKDNYGKNDISFVHNDRI